MTEEIFAFTGHRPNKLGANTDVVKTLLYNVLYILWSLQVDNSGPILANHLVFVAINIKGFVAWKQLTDQAAPSKV